MPRKPKGPPPTVPSCLGNASAGALLPHVPRLWEPTGRAATLIHVAFYDTRKRPAVEAMRAAAALFNESNVVLYALLWYPRPTPGMHVVDMSKLPPVAKCLHRNLKKLAHGPGPQYVLKPLLHLMMPTVVPRLILLDTDVVVLRGIAPLWAEFQRFSSTALIGIGNEQSNLCTPPRAPERRSACGSVCARRMADRKNATGKNGGVQLLHLQRMRSSGRYLEALDEYASGRSGRWIGYLGDQTLYSYMAWSHPDLLYQLGCEWNRQLSMQFGFRNATVHSCARPCMLLHANFGSLKCVAHEMQKARGACAAWQNILSGVSKCPSARKGPFTRAAKRFFSDCCV